MILPDVNLLVYAYNSDGAHHSRAAAWWAETVNSGNVGVPWPVFQSFLRLLSGRQVVTTPYTMSELFDIGQQWWDHDVKLLAPTRRTLDTFRTLCEKYQTVGSATSDAFIASFALEHRARLATNDTDFLRYTELRVINPLA